MLKLHDNTIPIFSYWFVKSVVKRKNGKREQYIMLQLMNVFLRWSTECSHTTTKTKHKMKSALLLDVVITNCPTILKLLSSKDQTLLIRRNALLVLDLGLHVVDQITWLNFNSDCLASQSLHKNLR